MNVSNNLNPSLVFLNASKLVEQAAVLDAIKNRTIKCIARLQADVDKRKAAAASRWKGTDSFGLNPVDRARIEGTEVNAAILEIRAAADKELDGLMKEAGAASALLIGSRQFFDSPVKVLNRITLGKPERTEYQRQVASVGPAELTHLGQYAVSTKNAELAAAIVTKLDTMPAGQRPFGAAALAAAMSLDEYHRGSQAIKIGDQMLQQIIIACRTWRAGKGNPLSTVQLALNGKGLDLSILDDLESGDA